LSKRYTSDKDRALLMLECGGKCKCGVRLERANTIVEHSTPLALGGLDILENKYLQCRDCAAIKTHGGSAKATTYGSDIHAIAKVRRLRGETKQGPKKQIQSRGFDKSKTRKC
jgi:hypothetical protein